MQENLLGTSEFRSAWVHDQHLEAAETQRQTDLPGSHQQAVLQLRWANLFNLNIVIL